MSKALSIKQPWAAMIACGMKDIEIRTWRHLPTYRGEIYIHTGKTADPIRQGSIDFDWTPRFSELVKLRQGLVARATLVEAKRYMSIDAFAADAKRHRNPVNWWDPSFIGLVLEDIESIDFIPMPGRLGLFNVEIPA